MSDRVKLTEETIEELIERKRAAGYDPEFEALLARPWVCPHCGTHSAILGVGVPVGDPVRGFSCPKCEREGIAPVESASPQLKLLDGGKRKR